jgi:cell division septum initiation protein DivIVA
VSENLIDERVKRLLAAVSADGKTSEHPVVSAGVKPNQALQVLTMAQRTAEQHVADANRDAAKIREAARQAAEKVGREAQEHADKVRRDAEKAMADSRNATDQANRDAQKTVDEARRQAEQIVQEARTRANTITTDARGEAQQLGARAQQRYDDFVGGLSAKREALQQQIEALENFDRDYRARLMSFMQAQLRALWVDEPQVEETPDEQPAIEAKPEESAEE